MELSTQIKKYRTEQNLSQEELAEKVYVSRQTISNWETNKSYPDIHSLILLSKVYEISLDQLIKGDIEIMKKEIKESEIQRFNYYGKIYTILFMLMVLSAVPLMLYLKVIGIVIWLILTAVTLLFAFKVEKLKKENDVQTYREIVAFTEGKRLDEIAKAKESGKRPYQKAFLAIGSAVIALVVCGALAWVLLK